MIPVYLDYNATTPVDPEVVEAMLPYITTSFGNPSSNYSIGRENREAVSRAKQQVAALINAQPEEICFNSGGTESNNHAILGTAFAARGRGKHIITSAVEHPAVTNVCRYLATQGWDITWLPVTRYGEVNPEDVENAVRPDTVLITIMHANNEIGTIQPVPEIAAIAARHHVMFHTDAAQSTGKLDVDVKAMGVDLLSIAGHKLYAPKGIGALFIKQGTEIDNLMHGAGQEKGLRPGTENVIQIVALGKACEIANSNLAENQRKMYVMRERLLQGLSSSLKHMTVHTDPDNSLPNTLSIAFPRMNAYTLTEVIASDVLISTGSACHSGITEISPVLKAMKVDQLAAEGTVRISTGKYTTGEEVDHAVQIISQTVLKLAAGSY